MAIASRRLRRLLLFTLAPALLVGACRDGEDGGRTTQADVLDSQRPAGTAEDRESGQGTEATLGERREPRCYRAVVALEEEDRVAILAGPPWRVVRRLPVPTGPHNVAEDPAGRYVAVSSPPAGRLTILDYRGEVSARPRVGAGAHDIAFTRSGRSLWVSAEGSGRIVKLNVRDGRLVRSVPTGGAPHDIAISPGGELWVTIDGSSAVEVRSARSGELLARPDLPPAPHDLAIDPGSGRVWFSNWSSPVLTVASLTRREPIGSLETGGEPHHFAFGAGSLWASDNAGGELLRIDPRSWRIRDRVLVGPAPHHVAVAGEDVLVAVHGRGELAVVSRRGRLQRRLDVGAGPHGLAVLRR